MADATNGSMVHVLSSEVCDNAGIVLLYGALSGMTVTVPVADLLFDSKARSAPALTSGPELSVDEQG